jgi:hypothetical protein
MTPWGMKPAHLKLSSGRHLPRAMGLPFSTEQIRLWVLMLKHGCISRPIGRCDLHRSQGCAQGDGDTSPYTPG